MIMPGQEQSVFTKEVLMISVSPDAPIDPFFLFWALGLDDVKKQWGRVVFMQTNREDLGNRYRLIEIPYTDDEKLAQSVSSPYKKYFTTLAAIQKELNETIISL